MADDTTILVTGATDGIGRITAEKLARKGLSVVLHGRSPRSLEVAAAEIRAATGNPKIETAKADFSSLDQVKELAGTISAQQSKLDALINNAGVGPGGLFWQRRQLSKDGHELRFQVNYLAPVLLTHLLLPLLRAAKGRIVDVASASQGLIRFDDLMLETGYGGLTAYSQSKSALIMHAFSLAEREREAGVTVNALDPGSLLDTKMVRQFMFRGIGRPDDGADAEVHLATSPELAGVTGQYFKQKQMARAHSETYDRATRERLWTVTNRLLEKWLEPDHAD